MAEYSVFDIMGPVMIGPSSSHTAGAARLSGVARKIVGEPFGKVAFYLHGSFARTYRGHGTDKALAAGALGLSPDDERLRDSLALAREQGIEIQFLEADLGECHENTVRMDFYTLEHGVFSVTGSSIGGGNILITELGGYDVEITGTAPTLIIRQNDQKGVISEISTVLAQNNINIAIMKVKRKKRGDEASTIIETDGEIPAQVLLQLKSLDNILDVKAVSI